MGNKISVWSSYRDSHKKEGMGERYDNFYATNSWHRFLWSREQEILSDFLDSYFQNRDIHLLDFACGTGRLTNFFENRVTTSVGVDVSESMLEKARKKLNHTELIQADLTKENVLQGRKFNLITAFRFFLNAEPGLCRSVLAALVPLLAEDGYLVFNNHRNRTSPLVWIRYVWARKIRRGTPNFMTFKDVKDMVKEARLEIVRIYPVGFLSLPKGSLPESWNHAVDKIATKFKIPPIFSESPVIVCQRRSKP
ncbi:hypothetical protein ES703_119258 [subsurface metagenome]